MNSLIVLNIGFSCNEKFYYQLIKELEKIIIDEEGISFMLGEWLGNKNNDFSFNEYKFNSFREVYAFIDKIENFNFLEIIKANEEKVRVSFPINGHPSLTMISFNYDLLENVLKIISKTTNIHYAYFVHLIDSRCQNAKSLRVWKRMNKKVPENVIIYENPQPANKLDTMIINIEDLPGHTHLMDYDEMLWFGSCWQMYFSSIYYKYIPKSLFDDFTECEENLILEKGLRKITLYNNVEEFDKSENRARQWAFRKYLGIDSIAHELTRSANRIEPQDLPVLITKKGCEIGQTKVIRFLNANNKLVARNLAERKEIKEYLDDGVTVVYEETIQL